MPEEEDVASVFEAPPPIPDEQAIPLAQEFAYPRPADQYLRAIQNCAGMLYTVAGLSLVNIVLVLIHSPFGLALGLLLPEVAAAFLMHKLSLFGIILAILSVIQIGCTCLFAYIASRGYIFGFVLGILVVCLDMCLGFYDVKSSFIAIAFHGYAIFRCIQGIGFCRQRSVASVS